MIFGGVEGGATHSTVGIYGADGSKLAQISGPATNHWPIGMEECVRRLAGMVNEAKLAAGMRADEPLESLGMCLSGCEQEDKSEEMRQMLMGRYPSLSRHSVVCCDTRAPVAAAHPSGGIVLISGTGSNALLINPDGSEGRCGGWGHMLGDEGGAYWISHKAVQTYFHEQDNYKRPPYPTDAVWRLIKEHFGIETRFDLLDYSYPKFDKSFFAGLCKRLAEAAHQGDPLCTWLFGEAGRELARYVRALVPSIHSDLVSNEGGVPVVCVGSVWKSWDLLKSEFHAELARPCTELPPTPALALLSLTTSSAVGAARLAAEDAGRHLPVDFHANYTVLFRYEASAAAGDAAAAGSRSAGGPCLAACRDAPLAAK